MSGRSEPISQASAAGLTDADLPEVFRIADQSSLAAQARFLRNLRLELSALAVGAAFGAYIWTWPGTETDVAALVAGSALGLAGILRSGIQRDKPERAWYNGRAAAESAKTLAWRYAVAGKPFPRESDGGADAEFVRRLREITASLGDLDVVPATDHGGQITAAMRSLRRSPLEVRKAAYVEGRVLEQRTWYATKARLNWRRARRWSSFLLATEAAGTLAAVVKATTALSLNLLPVTAAVVAGAAAWLQTKQHAALGSAYTIASLELTSVADLRDDVQDETEWAVFVDDAENAISREHAMWAAKRSKSERPSGQ